MHCLSQIVPIALSCSHTMLVCLLFIKRFPFLNRKKICFWKRHVSRFVFGVRGLPQTGFCSSSSDDLLQTIENYQVKKKRRHTSVPERKMSVKKSS